MQTSLSLNDQQHWGGQRFQPASATSPSIVNEQDQPTLVVPGRQGVQPNPLSQAGVIASSSDNLFHPVTNLPSLYVYSLPPVPSNPRLHSYDPPNTFQRPFPYRSPFSSYNNPTFAVPSCPTQANRVPTVVNQSLPSDPPIPLHIHSGPVLQPFQPQFHHPQPVYNHFQPAYNHVQPAYHHVQPAYHHIQPAFH